MTQPPGNAPNTVGNASLALGITSAALVFGLGICAVVGSQQGWLNLAGTPLFVCGASSAFLGLMAAGLGLAGLFGRGKPKAAAAAGMALGLVGLCLFAAVMRNFSG